MAKAGRFEIDIAGGGHPIWCSIKIDSGRFDGDVVEVRINALELRDLAYAVEKARIEARNEARRMDPDRVHDY